MRREIRKLSHNFRNKNAGTHNGSLYCKYLLSQDSIHFAPSHASLITWESKSLSSAAIPSALSHVVAGIVGSQEYPLSVVREVFTFSICHFPFHAKWKMANGKTAAPAPVWGHSFESLGGCSRLDQTSSFGWLSHSILEASEIV